MSDVRSPEARDALQGHIVMLLLSGVAGLVVVIVLVSLINWSVDRDYSSKECYRLTYAQCARVQLGYIGELVSALW